VEPIKNHESNLIRKQKELESKECNIFLLLLILFAVACLSITILKPNFQREIFLSLGVGTLTACIVAYFAHKRLTLIVAETQEIVLERNTEELRQLIKSFGGDVTKLGDQLRDVRNYISLTILMDKCNKLKLLHIYDDRRDRVLKPDIEKSIKKIDTKTIKILGTTHRDFFDREHGYLLELKKLAEVESSPDDVNEKSVKVLIVNPYSKEGIKRTLLEEIRKKKTVSEKEEYINRFKSKPLIEYEESRTWKDIDMVLTNYKNELNKVEELDEKDNGGTKYSIELKFYNDYPSLWLIVTDKKIFFQPYQYGTGPDGKKDIGEYFPIMLFERGDVYKLLSDHFDVKWNEKTNLCFKDMWKLFYNTDKEGMAEKSLRDYIKNYMQDASCNESLY